MALMEKLEVDLKLIDLVQLYPYLYNKKYNDFKDVIKKNNAWGDISCNVSANFMSTGIALRFLLTNFWFTSDRRNE